MSNLDSIYQAVQFVERNLKEPVSIRDIADAADYSLYHFSRTFNKMVGHSPYDYMMRRRLSESARDLVESDRKIIDIAIEYQFKNPETFSRAFRRMFGVLPNQVKHNKSLSDLKMKTPASFEYLQHINCGGYLRPVLVELDTLHLVGIGFLTEDGSGITGDLWEQLHYELDRVPHRLRPDRQCAVFFDPSGWVLSQSVHIVGVEVESLMTIPDALTGKSIPAHKYARFVHKGLLQDLGLTRQYVEQTWLPKSGSARAAPYEITFFGGLFRGPEDPDSECELLIPIEQSSENHRS